MLSLHITYLTSRCVATAYDDRQRAEWPPHPARVFSALVAAWAEADPPDPAEAAALEWLEAQGPPALSAGPAAPRTVHTTYVPSNDVGVVQQPDRQREKLAAADASGKPREVASARKALAVATQKATAPLAKASDKVAARARLVLPASRGRQPRTFPSVGLPDPQVHLAWDRDPGPHRDALARLAARVSHIGHSSSLVLVRVSDQAPAPTLVPDDSGHHVLRTVGPGQLASLVDEHGRHQGTEPRVLPCRFERYSEVRTMRSAPAPCSVFDDRWIVLRRAGGARLPITRAVDLAHAIRAALLECAEAPAPSVLHGHGPDGDPLERDHLAIVPLPFVGHEHADGSLLGAAIVLPRDVAPGDRQAVLRAIGRWEQQRAVAQGDDGPIVEIGFSSGRTTVQLERVVWGEARQATLQARAWCRPSRTWISVTPVALDRNPGNMNARDPEKQRAAWTQAADGIARACQRIGLPQPANVQVLPSVSIRGTRKSRQHPPYPPQDGRLRRVKTHAVVEFTEAVAGPVLLGAGRYVGLGLFRPVAEPGGSDGVGA